MIEKLDIESIHIEVDESARRYVNKKIGRLDRYMPKHVKESAHAEVILKANKDKKNKYTCEVTLHLPKETINAKESTVSIFAAIDIIEEKLKNRIQKYKEIHGNPRFRRHLAKKTLKKLPKIV